jgi:4-amino-4-deoxy-L-arabinose transferase-like glycosyltransferase
MPRAAARRDVLLVLFAGALTMLSRLDAGDLHLDGVLYAQVARGLDERGDWLDLTLGGDPYWRKPPLVFWLMGIAYRLGGVSEVTARLPSVLGGMGCAVAVYYLAARLFDARVGLLAGVILATTSPFVQNAVTARLDTVPAMLSLLALLAYLHAAESRRATHFAIAGVCVGLAVLGKGVFGLTGPFFFALYCASTGRGRVLVSPGFGVSVLVGLLVAVPWHAYELARWGRPFLDVYLFEQTVDRLTGRLGGHEQTASYFGSLLRDDWPWLPFTAAGAVIAILAARGGERRAAFLLAWTAGYFVLVSLSAGQRARYLTQLYPPASILAALAVLRPLPERWRERLPAATTAILLAGTVAVVVLPERRTAAQLDVRALGPVLDRLAPGARSVDGYRLSDLPLRASFLFYLGRDLRSVRLPEEATDGAVVAAVGRRDELVAAGFVPVHASGRFIVMSRGG